MRLRSAMLISCALTAFAQGAAAQATLFRFPLQSCPSTCATVSAYLDRDNSGATRDWNCGSQTYDGHRGTDFAIIGGFNAQDQGRTIVAGADGTVMSTHDGEPDRCTTGTCGGGGGFGNYVVLQHADGKLSYYAHMRRSSVRVMTGQRVRCGDALGLVGSSGNSTGPHVHFEVRVRTTATDSFEGRAACGGGATHWISQGVYRGLPGDSCATSPPIDSGVLVDAAQNDDARPDAPAPPQDSSASMDVGTPDVSTVHDASSDGAVTLVDAAVIMDAVTSSDGAARSDARADGGYNPNDWGGCSCRIAAASHTRSPRASALSITLAMLWIARRRGQSGRFAQQRKPVE